ncbi:MAG TPA: DUF4383 domain-containing protein [Pyrinomonadaceae bacterium]|nr:DUF4383 domain-containing protein [Pyrinomonadaceae bacterium]
MAKTICTLLGAVLLLVGLLGFISPGGMSDMTGAHLTAVHNVVHLLSGAIALYLGLKGTLAAARLFCLVFGAVYLLLGIVGYLTGGAHPLSAGIPGPPSDRLLRLLPGSLELGSADHGIHILLGIVFLIGGLLTKAHVDRVADRA